METDPKNPPQKDGETPEIVGDYRLLRFLGGGGMGKVFLAEHMGTGEKVALKTIRSQYQHDEKLLKRFYQEARTAARLAHPNIIKVTSAFRFQGLPFMTMEYLEGVTLTQLYKSRSRLAWEQALKVAGQVAAGLAHAHDNDVIHRDIKPDNIHIDPQGRVRILDLGLAKLTQIESNLTTPGMMIGTPAYLSPEQCAGKSAGKESDVYALGVVLYEAMSGARPFDADNMIAMTQKIIVGDIKPLDEVVPDLPADVLWLVNNMMHRDPAQRIQGVKLCNAIASVLAGLPISTGASMTAAFDSLRAELVSGDLQPSGDMKTPSVVDGVHFEQSTPSRISQLTLRKERRSKGRILALALVTVLLLALGGGAAFLWQNPDYWQQGVSGVAPVIESEFEKLPIGISYVRIQDPGYYYETLGWAQRGARLYLGGRSNTNSMRAERQRIVTLDMDAKVTTQLAFSQIELNTPFPFLSPAPPGPPYGGGVVSFNKEVSVTSGAAYRQLLFVHSLSLGSQPIFNAGTSEENINLATAHHGTLHDAALHPDGRQVALVLSDVPPENLRLVERKVSDSPLEKVSAPLLESTGTLSLYGYAADGAYIAAHTEQGPRNAKRNEFWAVASGAPGTPAKRLGLGGGFNTQAAWSPGPHVLATSFQIERDGKYTAFASRLADGRMESMGEGRIGPAPWHPSGAYIVLTAPAADGSPQLFAVTYPAAERTQLTGPGGKLPSYSDLTEDSRPTISHDGKWIAARLKDRRIAIADLAIFGLGY